MTLWPVADLLELARLIRLGGHSLRHTMQRLDPDEITIRQAILTMQAWQASLGDVAPRNAERP